MDNEIHTSSSSFFYKFKVGLVLALSLLVLAGIFMALLGLKKTRLKKLGRNYCTKKDCIHQAMNMQKNLDRSVQPCKHFFNFTCGNYKGKTIGLSNFIENTKLLIIQRYIDVFSNDSLKFIQPAENLRTFHNACVNLETRKKDYKKHMKNILKLLKWPPLIKNWNYSVSKKFKWLNLEENLIKRGLSNSLIQFASDTNVETKREMLLLNCAPSLITGAWSDILTEKTKMISFTRIVRNFIKIVNGRESLANEIVQIFIEIEKIKAATIVSKFNFQDTSTFRSIRDKITLGDLDNQWKIDFTKFCISIFPSYMNITKSTTIDFISDCPFRLVNFLSRTNKRAVAGYMLWEAAHDLLWIISDETRNLNLQIRKLFNSEMTTLDTTPHLTCYYFNSILLPELWSYIYVKTYYSEARKKKIITMLNLILDEGKALVKNSWLSDPSKKILYKKVSKIKYVVDHDNEFHTDEYIQSTFGNLNLNTSNMIDAVLNIQAHTFQRKWKIFTFDLKKRSIFKMHATEINAYYYRHANMLIIPAAVTIGMLYSEDFEGYLNFAGLGYIISHEIFHGLDALSLYFDDELNFGLWLNDKDVPLFDKKLQCFIHQYDNYNLTSKLTISGIKTLDENLADSGVLLAYRAYLKWLQTNKVKKLPGFGDYNERQLFWIMFGNMWCENYNEEYLENVYRVNDSHPIGKFRVLGTLSNIEEFSKDFDCPINSFMNPITKCKLYH